MTNGGITPAYAGNTPALQTHHRHRRDHPRLRGEHLIPPRSTSPKAGSPPLTRGTRTAASVRAWKSGITPAYAGNTGACTVLKYVKRDHPRLRGEHSFVCELFSAISGSPPLTRGTPGIVSSEIRRKGITPAYAGNTKLHISKLCRK